MTSTFYKFSLILCTIFVLFGFFVHIFSLLIFRRVIHYGSKVASRIILILFSLSNIVFLFFYSIDILYARLIESFEINESNILAKFYISNKFNFACRFVKYILFVTFCFNSLSIAFYSIERAIAVYKPIELRSYRANNERTFNIIGLIIATFSLLFPVYNLIMFNINLEYNSFGNLTRQCVVDLNYRDTYIKLELADFIITVTLPFTIIAISNLTIIFNLYKQVKKRKNNHFEVTMLINFRKEAPSDSIKRQLKMSFSSHMSNTNFTADDSLKLTTKRQLNQTKSNNIRSISNINTRLIKILIIILMVYLILNVPYIITYFATMYKYMAYVKGNSDFPKIYLVFLDYTHFLNLIYICTSCFFYFANIKNYCHHFMVLLGIKPHSSLLLD